VTVAIPLEILLGFLIMTGYLALRSTIVQLSNSLTRDLFRSAVMCRGIFFKKNSETNSFDLLELFDRSLTMARLICSFLFLSIFVLTQNVKAQSIEISVYGGIQSSPHSRITGKHSTSGAQYSELVGWEGKSFDAPIYYGIRTTFWRNDKLGYGAEFTHAKAYAPSNALQNAGFDRLEFTDGHNIITFNINRLWELGDFKTYSIVGLGIAMPHVDALPSGGLHTFEYQYTGPAVRAALGLSHKLNEDFSIFTEYQFTASDNKVSLRNGGTLNTKLLTNAVNLGVSYNF